MVKIDIDGNKIHKRVRREGDGWGVTVYCGWFPAICSFRYVYKTRRQARQGDALDDVGINGRIA
jgi:hypothetical protein